MLRSDTIFCSKFFSVLERATREASRVALFRQKSLHHAKIQMHTGNSNIYVNNSKSLNLHSANRGHEGNIT